jgi:hypothetical protein
MPIRPQSKPAQVDSPPKIIRVRGVVVGEATENRRLKWDGEAYTETQDVIEFFPDSGDEPKELEEDAEAMCVWMPAAARWEEFSGGGSASIIGSYGYLLLDLTASGITGTFPHNVTPVEDAVKVLQLVHDGTNYRYEVAQTDDAEPVDLIVAGICPPNMPIKAGVTVPGNLITLTIDDEEVKVFEVQWSDYKYGIPGWTDETLQSIGHDDAVDDEMAWQDDGECA